VLIQARLINLITALAEDPERFATSADKPVLELHLAMSQAGVALGRFVVEGLEHDAAHYMPKIARVIVLLEQFRSIDSQTALRSELNIYHRLAESIVASRRSPLSNVAWHTIKIKVRPLAMEIERELNEIADAEVVSMRDGVEHIAHWTQALAFGSVAALAILIVLALVLAHTEARRISAPVARLCRATEALSQG
jgi:hypothetical protein